MWLFFDKKLYILKKHKHHLFFGYSEQSTLKELNPHATERIFHTPVPANKMGLFGT